MYIPLITDLAILHTTQTVLQMYLCFLDTFIVIYELQKLTNPYTLYEQFNADF